MFVQKVLTLGLAASLAPAFVASFQTGDPFYVCLRDDGTIASGAEATCNQGSFAAKFDRIWTGSDGDKHLHFADSQQHEYTLNVGCSKASTASETPTTVTKIVTSTNNPVTITSTITPPPDTKTATQTSSSTSNNGGNLCTTGKGFCVDQPHSFTVAADCPHDGGWEIKGCQCFNTYSYDTRTPDCNAGYTFKYNGCS